MNPLEIKAYVEACRQQWPILSARRVPIDILTFLDAELGLDIIPIPGLRDAALARDWSGIYVNKEAFEKANTVKPFVERRFRFTLAHEFAHWYLHRELAASRVFKTVREMLVCLRGSANSQEEVEANEFAGQLLVPADSLWEKYKALNLPRGPLPPAVRRKFCENLEGYYGVNDAVIGFRLEREGIWPSA